MEIWSPCLLEHRHMAVWVTESIRNPSMQISVRSPAPTTSHPTSTLWSPPQYTLIRRVFMPSLISSTEGVVRSALDWKFCSDQCETVKVKLFLCLIMPWRHEYRYSSTISSRFRWMASFTPQPFYPGGKTCRYPLDKRLGGPQSWSWMWWRREKFCLCQELNLSHPAHGPSLYWISSILVPSVRQYHLHIYIFISSL
jgi:hypothetical protein